MKKTKILFLTKYSNKGASSRYRFLNFRSFLSQNGFSCTYAPFFDDNYLEDRYKTGRPSFIHVFKAFYKRFVVLFTLKKYDLVVLEKELFPYFPAIFERFLYLAGIKYIVDYDDALFHQYDQHRLKIIRKLLGRKISAVMRYSYLVMAGNSYLADYARASGAKNVQIIPTVIDTALYSSKTLSEKKEESFTIGWIGSPSTAKYLADIEKALSCVCADENSRVVLIGAGKSPFLDLQVELVPWKETTEISEMHKFDVGIMPLPDNPWERGKCGFKLIQYMGCSLPVVASPVGVNCEIVTEGINGFLASSQQEWTDALLKLRDDYQLRLKMGLNGQNKVQSDYSINVVQSKIADLYRQTIMA